MTCGIQGQIARLSTVCPAQAFDRGRTPRPKAGQGSIGRPARSPRGETVAKVRRPLRSRGCVGSASAAPMFQCPASPRFPWPVRELHAGAVRPAPLAGSLPPPPPPQKMPPSHGDDFKRRHPLFSAVELFQASKHAASAAF